MMRGWPVVLMAASLAAQKTPPGGVTPGTVLECDNGAVGTLTVRAKDNRVTCFQFDARTFVERGGARVTMAGMGAGDAVEVFWEDGARPLTPYALLVRLLPATTAVQPSRRPTPRPLIGLWDDSAFDELFPRGNLTFAGRVRELSAERLVLAARKGPDIAVLLRPDTRYFLAGQPANQGLLRVNATVFVRGGKNFDGEIEAYQVVWGDILKPD